MRSRFHTAPIIAAVLLLLPVPYVGSYLALVKPGSYWYQSLDDREYICNYRYFGKWAGKADLPWTASIAPKVFWPLEQIDRKLRPGVWE